MVKSLVELYNGSVVAHSDAQTGGREFSVRLPRLRNGTAAPTAQGAAPQLATTNSMRLMVVDDNIDGAKVMVEHDPLLALQRARQGL